MRKTNLHYTIFISALLLIFSISTFSCNYSKLQSSRVREKKPESKLQVEIDYQPKPAQSEKAMGVRVKLNFPAKKVSLKILGGPEAIEKTLLLKKQNPQVFSGVFLAPTEGVYRIFISVVDESSKTVEISENLPLIHVVSQKKKKTTPEKLILDYLDNYYSLLPSNYKEIKIKEMQKVERKGESILYRVTFEASKYEEGRLKETVTMFFVLKEGAEGTYIEYASKALPPNF